MRIAFVAHSLETGGSERQLTTLACGLANQGHAVRVFTLRGGGALGHELERAGIVCTDPARGRPWYRPGGLVAVVRALRRFEPDVVHPYLVVPNLLLAALQPFLGRSRLVWGVRAAGEGNYHRLSALTFRATCIAARVPRLIIANSEAGRRYHVEHGYPSARVVVIENGIDSQRYRPDPAGREQMRASWGIAPDVPLVGIVARLDPLKDHETFLRAAGALAREDATVRFVCVGGTGGPRFTALTDLARSLGLDDRLNWAGEHDDLTPVYSALDVACLASRNEGFPNVVAEAMACGTPCVVTDVGDAARIVEGVGVVVPPGEPRELTAGLRILLDRVAGERDHLADAARHRIVERYSVERLVERTDAALRSLGSPAMPSETAAPADVFAFGENWSRFLTTIDEERIDQATADLGAMLEHKDLEGATFLDIGSGSGLSSLAAHRLGARVHSFDYDAASVACTTELRRRYDPDAERWTVERGSVLDREYLDALGAFDVVYSWGVLHHTGAMWEAMDNVVDLVAPGGTLFVALYNDQGRRSRVWRVLKQLYVRGPAFLRIVPIAATLAVYWLPRIALDTLRGSPLQSWRSYGTTRGMSAWHDVVDWAGGYPFEVASAGQVHEFYRQRGFRLERLVSRSGSGCNELVFVREGDRAIRDA